MKPKEILELVKKRYYQEDTRVELKSLYNRFPDFHYRGVGFRVVILDEDPLAVDSESFTYVSWAKSFSGLLAFLDHAQAHLHDQTRLKIFKGHIEGLDLAGVLSRVELNGQLWPQVEAHQIRREEEVFNFSIQDLEDISEEFIDEYISLELQNMFEVIESYEPEYNNERGILKTIEEQEQTLENWQLLLKYLKLDWFMQITHLLHQLHALREALYQSDWNAFNEIKKRIKEVHTSLYP